MNLRSATAAVLRTPVVFRFDKTPRATPRGRPHGLKHICHRHVEHVERSSTWTWGCGRSGTSHPRGISVRQSTSCHTTWQTPRPQTHLPQDRWAKTRSADRITTSPGPARTLICTAEPAVQMKKCEPRSCAPLSPSLSSSGRQRSRTQSWGQHWEERARHGKTGCMGQEAARERLGAELGTRRTGAAPYASGNPRGSGAPQEKQVCHKRTGTGRAGAVQPQRASPSHVPDEITGTTWPESTEPGCGSVGSPAGKARVRGNPTLPMHRHHCSPVSSLVRFSH